MFFTYLTPVLLLVAFILLLLVTLSLPIIKSIFLFELVGRSESSFLNSGASGDVRFGVFGYCTGPVSVKVVGFSKSSVAECSKSRLGYSFDSRVADALGVDGFANLISRTTTAALVLHPIACGLTFIALVLSLFMLCRKGSGTSRVASLLTLGSGILAAILTTIVFLIDVILVAIVRRKVNDNEGRTTVQLSWGNAVWMALGATIALWLALIGACARICVGRRNKRAATY